jgi:hypothetical protein
MIYSIIIRVRVHILPIAFLAITIVIAAVGVIRDIANIRTMLILETSLNSHRIHKVIERTDPSKNGKVCSFQLNSPELSKLHDGKRDRCENFIARFDSIWFGPIMATVTVTIGGLDEMDQQKLSQKALLAMEH